MTNVIHAMEKNRLKKKRVENAGARSGKMAMKIRSSEKITFEQRAY